MTPPNLRPRPEHRTGGQGHLASEVEVSVPASSANLGPGFDALGLALGLRDRVTAVIGEPGQVGITIVGEGAESLSRDATHLVYRAMARGFEVLDLAVPGVRLRCENLIPQARGLGSSSAAIVAGLAVARGLSPEGQLRMDDEALFATAAEMEGHPDNVAPAVYGGFTIAFASGGTFRAVNSPVDTRIEPVLLIPESAVETQVARAVLPELVSHAAATHNAARAALLVRALATAPDLLFEATHDQLHQEYRAPVMPETWKLVADLRGNGIPAVVSGAGPSVLCLCTSEVVAQVSAQAPDFWRVLRPGLDVAGLRVTVR